MTDISNEETAEVLWASSEQGIAAVKAAWEEACKLRVTEGRYPDKITDYAPIVYAAHLAAGWDSEAMEGDAEPAHLHAWTTLGVQPYIPWVVIGKPIPHIRVLLRCSECGEPDTRTLPGEWTLEDLQATEVTS